MRRRYSRNIAVGHSDHQWSRVALELDKGCSSVFGYSGKIRSFVVTEGMGRLRTRESVAN